ncbi:hypothetical protein OG589_14570 [Sphaerisporangium sp. NBC_01403]|uniref:hypothetical protein n=1 Tax=Sphaerisporangium sp. NBC_01403 TaxID=2903599 RepID=UPI00324D7A29
MSELELPAVDQTVIVRSGDVLVLRLGADVSLAAFEMIREQLMPAFKERLPGVEVLLLGGGVEQMAVFRRDESPHGDPT